MHRDVYIFTIGGVDFHSGSTNHKVLAVLSISPNKTIDHPKQIATNENDLLKYIDSGD